MQQIRFNIIISRMLPFLVGFFLISGLAGGAGADDGIEEPAKRSIRDVVKEDVVYTIKVYDPWEGMNRRIYRFNYVFDKYIYLPVVSGYERITPDLVEKGVTNFFKNLYEIRTLTNSLLQLKFKTAFKTAGRFVINSTLGVAGIFDSATVMGVSRESEDFGQTLGHYGLGSGPYLVLPILGPSNIRDTGGLVFDAVVYNYTLNEMIDELRLKCSDEDDLKLGLFVLGAIDARHTQTFRYYRTGSPFEYDLIRLLYTKKRRLEIER